ncbi:MAG TPA: cupin domain-containing protein [Solirubrobacteraceae bacterium]|jgi:uncharacterized cupin superfamily protein|nr:cupin domain-containing protein [Solirubrobacteraceae bacterium]
MRKVNVFECPMDEHHDRGTIANRGAGLGPKLAAERIGAGLYEVDAESWVWPFHYHHGVEEWLYVLSGSPTLRDRRGERELIAGDFVCFPSGHVGAHTVAGPGRIVIFSVGGWPQPSVAVYPDSDKIGVRPGQTGVPGLDTLDFPREAAVDYWYREGSSDPVEPPEPVRAPRPHYRPHAVNIAEVDAYAPEGPGPEAPDGFRHRLRALAPLLAADRLGATLIEIDPGQGGAPYHCEHGREEWLLVLAGAPLVRHPDGEDVLAAGDLVCFRDGRAGARRLTNPGSELVRAIVFSTQEIPSVRELLDSRKMLVRYSRDHDARFVDLQAPENAEHWEGGLV